MTSHLRYSRVRIAAILLFLLALAAPVHAQAPQPGFAREGGFAGVSFLPEFKFDGVTFDGVSAYQLEGSEEIIILPRLDTQPLVRGILGFRARNASLEISYDRTKHDGTFEDFGTDVTIQAVNVDGRYFFLPTSRIQPHVLVGGSFPWVRVKEGSFLDGEAGDARYRGYGLNTEAGVTIYPHPRFGISGGYSFRWMWFDRATGVSDTFGELRPRFREEMRSVIITAILVI
jgi:hypothetical protein